MTQPPSSAPARRLRLLLAEDSEDDMAVLLHQLRRAGFDVSVHRVLEEAELRRALQSMEWDLVISDFNLPKISGIQVLETVRELQPDLPFILVSGSIGEQLAVQAMRTGAQDYIMKNNLARLGEAVAREMREADAHKQRRETEELLADTSKRLQVAQRIEAIGRLAGGIAHDLNNMIGACTLYAERALDPELSIEEVRENVREIMKTQERSARVVRQLLAFGGRQVSTPQVVTLNQMVEETRKMFERILGADVSLEIRLDDQPGAVLADPANIDQVIMNLVLNARDAMPSGGRLLIETGRETIDSGPEVGSYVRLSVEDTGMGMNAETQARVFEPFFTTKGPGKGTGLGLATVYGIVQKAHGLIRLRSEVGKGTRFDVFFRVTQESPAKGRESAAEKSSPGIRASGGTILLVEDDPGMRSALQETLESQGYQLMVAEDGEEGKRLFTEHHAKIDLLVTDVVMPKLSGPEMVRALRAIKLEFKTLFLSGYGGDILEAHDVQMKDTYLLPKPFSGKQLALKIAEILAPH